MHGYEREELRQVLEDGILIKLRHGDNGLPIVDRMNLNGKTARRGKVA